MDVCQAVGQVGIVALQPGKLLPQRLVFGDQSRLYLMLDNERGGGHDEDQRAQPEFKSCRSHDFKNVTESEYRPEKSF
jgi:hypothetical protein